MPRTFPDYDHLNSLPTISEGYTCDLKIDTGDFRLFLARTDMNDGEPYNHTAYVETLENGKWIDLGYYDADNPPTIMPGVTPLAFKGYTPPRNLDGHGTRQYVNT